MAKTQFTKRNKQRGKKACQCWDCIRAEGLTPPRPLLHKHKALYVQLPENPYIVKNKKDDAPYTNGR